MAISEPHYRAIRELHGLGELHQGGSILEIGEANYYGDMPLAELRGNIIHTTKEQAHHLQSLFAGFEQAGADLNLFAVAKFIYQIFWQPSEIVSIDGNGTELALRIDLNSPIRIERNGVLKQFETVINHGTAEHIFNIANVFKVMHDHCKAGGLMIHESPFTGWVDHGFYTLQPTLFFDLASVNGYDIRYMAIEQIESKLLRRVFSREQIHELTKAGEIPNNAMLYVAMRKTVGGEFKIPMQGVYSGSISESAKDAWQELR